MNTANPDIRPPYEVAEIFTRCQFVPVSDARLVHVGQWPVQGGLETLYRWSIVRESQSAVTA